MPTIDVNLDGDNAWPDLENRAPEIVYLADSVWQLAVLEGGMASGAPSLALRLDAEPGHLAVRPDGPGVVIAETSLAAWIAATCALRGRFPEAFAGTPLEAPSDPRTWNPSGSAPAGF